MAKKNTTSKSKGEKTDSVSTDNSAKPKRGRPSKKSDSGRSVELIPAHAVTKSNTISEQSEASQSTLVIPGKQNTGKTDRAGKTKASVKPEAKNKKEATKKRSGPNNGTHADVPVEYVKKIEVTADNVDEVIANAHTAEDAEKAAAQNKAGSKSKVESISAAPEPVIDDQMRVYSDSIRIAIQNHFRLMSVQEVRELLDRGKSSYPFTYEIKVNPAQPQNQIYLELQNGNGTARVPNNPSEFINVNG